MNAAWFYLACLLLVVATGIAVYFYRSHRRLAKALAVMEQEHQSIKIKEARHRLLADNATDVFWMMDLDGRFTYVSPSVYKLRGYTSEEVMQQNIEEALTAESIPIALKALGESIAAMLQGLPFIEFRGELEQPCKDGSTVWTELTTSGMKNTDGAFIGILGVTRNITERKKVEEQVRQLAFYDPLTHLPNRRLLHDRFAQLLSLSKWRSVYGAVMFLDLDRFKALNDTHGHAAGDLLLIEAANRIKNCVRESDTVSRFGGDEFVVLISELMESRVESITQAKRIAEDIRSALAQVYRLSIPHENQANMLIEHHCSASIGMALFGKDESSQEDILKWADQTMYEAKQAGRNQIRLYGESL